MSVLDTEGRPLTPSDRAMTDTGLRLAESIYGIAPESRVHDLRVSVLGDAAGPGPNTGSGIAAWLPEKPPAGVIDLPSFGADRHPSLVIEVRA